MLSKAKKKFIGDRAFYKMVLAVAVPIMIQSGITNFVSMLDNIMVGQVGTEQMSGVAIVNQLLIGYYIVKAEPAIQVLNHQVEDVTNGAVSARAMNRCLSVGVSVSV